MVDVEVVGEVKVDEHAEAGLKKRKVETSFSKAEKLRSLKKIALQRLNEKDSQLQGKYKPGPLFPGHNCQLIITGQ